MVAQQYTKIMKPKTCHQSLKRYATHSNVHSLKSNTYLEATMTTENKATEGRKRVEISEIANS